MKKTETELKDCYIIEPDKFGDERGYFSPYFIAKEFQELGFQGIVQANESMSSKGVVRGLHFQKNPKCQAKIVEVIDGAAVDVVVDIREDSPTYGKWTKVLLTPENNCRLYVPRGFAHGFVSLEDHTKFRYFVDNDYAPELEDGILWNDEALGIDWEKIFQEYGIETPLLSEKDRVRLPLSESTVKFRRTPKKYLITGANGQLGYDIAKELQRRGETEILAIDKDTLDITDKEACMELITAYHPDVIFHCAAWTQVDRAEEEEELCRLVNVVGTKNITEASIQVGAKLLYLSTDYVYDGTKEGLYQETDAVNPKSVYGKTKYEGEEIVRQNPHHYIARTSWVFGIHGKNFVKTMLQLADTHPELNVVKDQVGSPTYTVDLARLLVDMSEEEKYGTYHATNEDYCSWAEFAKRIFAINGKETKVNPVTTEEYLKLTGTKQAYRPRNSRLSKEKLQEQGFTLLPTWENALTRYSEELKHEKVLERKK